MGDLDKIANPIVLEERTLDLTARKKFLEDELKKLEKTLKYEEREYQSVVAKLKKFENIAGPKKETNSNADNLETQR
jgi:hypothetical protein